ncbi:hypothetical protein PUN71_022655 [Arthrobacter sp. NQ7]|uniref:hypothetical protein n=1 Tax=Arthrobacter sp. NQ7 TaxID=3032303 RepID=UPI00240F9012|nr:hypothetical protein [Arthrobacter sp. NQ7]MDJ0460014.1 hypothetical protein [Arthrobacter sp. NQ7]
MVKVRSITKAGVTARFAGGRFILMRAGTSEFVAVESVPGNDREIIQALTQILDRY